MLVATTTMVQGAKQGKQGAWLLASVQHGVEYGFMPSHVNPAPSTNVPVTNGVKIRQMLSRPPMKKTA